MPSSIPARMAARALLAGGLTALALAAAACGGSSSSSSSSTLSTSAPTTTSSSATTSTTSTPSDVQSAFDAALRKNLIESQHLSPQVADCVISKLHATLSDQELQQIASGNVPQSLTKKAFQAGFGCANAGG